MISAVVSNFDIESVAEEVLVFVKYGLVMEHLYPCVKPSGDIRDRAMGDLCF